MGIELKLQPIDWNNKQSELENGNVDCLWNGFSKTPERDEQFNLSIPYMKNEQIILVKTDSDYQTLEDLAGKTIGVQAVSYTHLDVYKRQARFHLLAAAGRQSMF